MQNYRSNAMPYNSYRQMSPSTSVMRRDSWESMSLAMAYVPWQTWRDIYEAEKGFHHGTIFKELNKPFSGKGGGKR